MREAQGDGAKNKLVFISIIGLLLERNTSGVVLNYSALATRPVCFVCCVDKIRLYTVSKSK